MLSQNRREFLQMSLAGAAFVATQPREAAENIRLGLIVRAGREPERALAKVHELALPTAQVGVEDFGPEMVSRMRTRGSQRRQATRGLAV